MIQLHSDLTATVDLRFSCRPYLTSFCPGTIWRSAFCSWSTATPFGVLKGSCSCALFTPGSTQVSALPAPAVRSRAVKLPLVVPSTGYAEEYFIVTPLWQKK